MPSITIWPEISKAPEEKMNVQVSEDSDIQHSTLNVQLEDEILLDEGICMRRLIRPSATSADAGVSDGTKVLIGR
jgi:hypothetical protein